MIARACTEWDSKGQAMHIYGEGGKDFSEALRWKEKKKKKLLALKHGCEFTNLTSRE